MFLILSFACFRRRPIRVSSVVISVLMAFTVTGSMACSQSGAAGKDDANTVVAGDASSAESNSTLLVAEQSPFTEGCRVLAPEELIRLQELQPYAPYAVLVPTCIPKGYNLDFKSIMKRPPLASASDTTRPDYEKKPMYQYVYTDGVKQLRFSANLIGDPPISSVESRVLRGRQATIYYNRGSDLAYTAPRPPLESSSFYYVLWAEDRDLPPATRTDAYMLYGQLDWDRMSWIVNGMVPIDQAVPAADGVCNIRGYDWSTLLGTKEGNDHIERTLYSDLDGDGAEEALVQRRIEGSGGYFSVYVFDCSEAGLQKTKVFPDLRRGEVTLGSSPGTFVIKGGIFEANDRNCCPSNFGLATYSWSPENGDFVVVSHEVVHNPEDQT